MLKLLYLLYYAITYVSNFVTEQIKDYLHFHLHLFYNRKILLTLIIHNRICKYFLREYSILKPYFYLLHIREGLFYYINFSFGDIYFALN